MLKDFKEVNGIRQKFPTVVPFVLNPSENVEQTRRMLKLLPHMDHFVNFLGQDLALEFLNKRSDFRYNTFRIVQICCDMGCYQHLIYRIKSVSKAYARSSIIDKIVVPNQQGIIFNVGGGDVIEQTS